MKKLITAITLLTIHLFTSAQTEYVSPSEKINQVARFIDNEESAKAINILKSFNVNDSFYDLAGSFLYAIYDLELKETNNALDIAEKYADNLLLDSRSYFYRNAGKTAFYGQEYQRGIDILRKGIKAFPKDVRLYDYLSKNYIMMGMDSLAYQTCLKGLEINPFNPGLLENLGELNAIYGNYTQAAMAWYLGLFCTYHDNENYYNYGGTSILNSKFQSILKGNYERSAYPFNWRGDDETEDKYKKEGIPKPISPTFVIKNYYPDTDKILEGGLALNARYKSRVKMNFVFAKQTQMMGDALKNESEPKIKGKDYFFYNNILANLIEKVNADNVKLKHFQSSIASLFNSKYLNKMRKTYVKKGVPVNIQIQRIMSNALYDQPILFQGKLQKIDRIYNTYNFHWDALGKLKDKSKDNDVENREGVWEYFYQTGSLESRGAYKLGKRDGTWDEYNDKEILKSSFIYKDGELLKAFSYEDNGVINMVRNFKDKELVDSFIFYYPDGTLRKWYHMPKGVKNIGTMEVYHQNGVKMLNSTVKNFDIQNSYLYYDKFGVKTYDVSIKDGKKEGPVFDYYTNGQLYAKGNNKNDKKEGLWEYFNEHGIKQAVNNYKDGELDGKQEYFDFLGNLTSVANYKKGKLEGEVLGYHSNGKLRLIEKYKNDELVSVEDFDKDGKSINKKTISGTTKVETKHFNGKIRSVGKILGGKKEGQWDFFSDNGVLIKSVEYKYGEEDGKTIEYYATGAKYAEYFSKKDKFDGKYISYYASGRKRSEGFYKNGEREGEWLWFYTNGAISSRLYYIDGDQYGFQDRYDVLGKRYASTYFKDDWNYYRVSYDSMEVSIDTLDYQDRNAQFYYSLNAAGDTSFISGLLHNKIHGQGVYNPKMEGEYTANYVFGELDGKYVSKDALGQKSTEKEYEKGDLVSYTTFNPRTGKVIYEAKYVNGDIDGLLKDYYPNGAIQEEINYIRSVKHGVTKLYATDGSLVLVLIYENGDIVSFGETEENQTPLTQASHKISFDYPNGNPKIRAELKYGNFDNQFKIYNKDGKPALISSYKNAVRNGSDSVYDAKGQLIKTMVYVDGDNNGLVQEYENGKPTRITNYLNDERHGWEYHYRNGKLIKSIYYYNSDPIITK